jgi:hypothetical protein
MNGMTSLTQKSDIEWPETAHSPETAELIDAGEPIWVSDSTVDSRVADFYESREHRGFVVQQMRASRGFYARVFDESNFGLGSTLLTPKPLATFNEAASLLLGALQL